MWYCKILLLILVDMFATTIYCQSNKNYFVYQVDIGVSRLNNYPDTLYFQGGLNGSFAFGYHHRFSEDYVFGIDFGVGISRFFIDANLVNSTLAAAPPNVRQQDFNVSTFRGSFLIEKTIKGKLIFKMNQGIVYYYNQKTSAKVGNNSSVVKTRSSLSICKPITDLGMLYDFRGRPNLNLGIIIRTNFFGKNFSNGNPLDFNVAMRFRFNSNKSKK